MDLGPLSISVSGFRHFDKTCYQGFKLHGPRNLENEFDISVTVHHVNK